MSRTYFVKALSSPRASGRTKATAHALLVKWYMNSGSGIGPRHFFSACHHANQAARLGRNVVPPGLVPIAPDITSFMMEFFENQVSKIPELTLFYKDAWRGIQERHAVVSKRTEKTAVKRTINPSRYKCAAVGCGIESDTGKMLARCTSRINPSLLVLTITQAPVHATSTRSRVIAAKSVRRQTGKVTNHSASPALRLRSLICRMRPLRPACRRQILLGAAQSKFLFGTKMGPPRMPVPRLSVRRL